MSIPFEPYIGPRHFTREIDDQTRFFGRDDEAEEIVSLILSHRAVLVYAQSGAGKTSIFEAKIAPELETYGFRVLPRARVGVISEEELMVERSPNYYMLRVFQSIEQELRKNEESYKFQSSYYVNKSLSDFIREHFSDPPPQVVLVLDQFEELFTLPSRIDVVKQRLDFFIQIAKALEQHAFLRIVFLMREDYLAELDPYTRFIPGRLRARLRLERLRKSAAIDAVEGPLKTDQSRRFFRQEDIAKEAREMVDDLLKMQLKDPFTGDLRKNSTGNPIEVQGEYVEPIQLQVVCQRYEWLKRVAVSSKNLRDNDNQGPEPLNPYDRDRLPNNDRFRWFRLKWVDEHNKIGLSTHAVGSKPISDVDKALREYYEIAVDKACEETDIDEKHIRKLFSTKFITSSGTRSAVNSEHIREVIHPKKKGQSIPPIKIMRQLYNRFHTRNRQQKRDFQMQQLQPSSSSIYRQSAAAGAGVVKKYRIGERLSSYSIYRQSAAAGAGVVKKYRIGERLSSTKTALSSVTKGRAKGRKKEDLLLDSLTSNFVIRPIGATSLYEITHDRLIGPIKDSNASYEQTMKAKSYGTKIKIAAFVAIAAVFIYPIVTLLIMGPPEEYGDSFPVGQRPFMISYDPQFKKVYASSFDDDSVSIIDTDREVDSVTKVDVGDGPMDIGINSQANRAYIANYRDGTVSVIDTRTDKILDKLTPPPHTSRYRDKIDDYIRVGNGPVAIGTNPNTNLIYVVNSLSNTTSVISGRTNMVLKEIPVGNIPLGIAVNPNTNLIYIANYYNNSISVINGSTNQVISNIRVGLGPIDIAINDVTEMIYVANYYGDTISVINGTTNELTDIEIRSRNIVKPFHLEINPDRNLLYVANSGSNITSVINGETNREEGVGRETSNPFGFILNIEDNKMYRVSPFENKIISHSIPEVETIRVGNRPMASVIDTDTDLVYVANLGSNSISIIDSKTKARTDVKLGGSGGPFDIDVDSDDSRVYAYNSNSNSISVLGTDTNGKLLDDIELPSNFEGRVRPYESGDMAVNSKTDSIYVTNYHNNTVLMLEPIARQTMDVSHTTSYLPPKVVNKAAIDTLVDYNLSYVGVSGHPTRLVVDPENNLAYVATAEPNMISVLSGTEKIDDIPISSYPFDIAINPYTNYVYVTHRDGISVISGTDSPKVISNLGGSKIAIDKKDNIIFLYDSFSSRISAVDGATNKPLLRNIDVGFVPSHMSISNDGGTLFMTNTDYGYLVMKDKHELLDAQSEVTKDHKVVSPRERLILPDASLIHVPYLPLSEEKFLRTEEQLLRTEPSLGTEPSHIGPAPTYGEEVSLYTHVTNLAGIPNGIAVNPVSNLIYASIRGIESNGISVINGSTNNVVSTIPVHSSPAAVFINPNTNLLYLTNSLSNTVSVVNVSTNRLVADILVGQSPQALAVNPNTNLIYVVNSLSNTTSVISGRTNMVLKEIPVGNMPLGIAVNPNTNLIYVVNSLSNTTSVINSTNGRVVKDIEGFYYPVDVAVNPNTNLIYIANYYTDSISVVDGATNRIVTNVGSVHGPSDISINQDTNFIYVTNLGSNTTSVIDGSTNRVVDEIQVGDRPFAISLNPNTNEAYVTRVDEPSAYVIDLSRQFTVNKVHVGFGVEDIAVNPNTGALYTANYDDDIVSVVNVTNNEVAQRIDVGVRPADISINQDTNFIYVTNLGSNTTSVIDGSTNRVVDEIQVGASPIRVAINPNTNVVYIANYKNDTVSVVDGTTNEVVQSIPVGSGPIDMDIDQNANLIYVANYYDDDISVINGTTNNVMYNIELGSKPIDISVNPNEMLLYISDESSDKSISAVDIMSKKVVNIIPVGERPNDIITDTKHSLIYVANEHSEGISVIDGTSNQVIGPEFKIGITPSELYVDPLGETVYVAGKDTSEMLYFSSQSVCCHIPLNHR